MTTTTNHTARELANLERGQSFVIRDGAHAGVTIVRGRNEWIVVDLENGGCSTHQRLRLVESSQDGEETGLNNLSVGCDLDGKTGLWLIPGDAELTGDDIEVVWDSEV